MKDQPEDESAKNGLIHLWVALSRNNSLGCRGAGAKPAEKHLRKVKAESLGTESAVYMSICLILATPIEEPSPMRQLGECAADALA